MTKQAFEKKFWELWFQDQTEAEKKVKWLPSKRPTQVVEEYLEYLRVVSNIKKPSVLEIGVKEGHQRRFYEKLLKCRRYFSIDINENCPAIICGNPTDPDMIAVMNVLEPDGWDIIFIDGKHSREGVRADYDIYRKMVRPGGYLVLHDIAHDHWKGVDGAVVLWQKIKEDYQMTIEIVYQTDYLPYQKGTKIRKQAGIGVIPI